MIRALGRQPHLISSRRCGCSSIEWVDSKESVLTINWQARYTWFLCSAGRLSFSVYQLDRTLDGATCSNGRRSGFGPCQIFLPNHVTNHLCCIMTRFPLPCQFLEGAVDGTSGLPFHLVPNTSWPTSERPFPVVEECDSNLGHRLRFGLYKHRPKKRRDALSFRNPESRLSWLFRDTVGNRALIILR